MVDIISTTKVAPSSSPNPMLRTYLIAYNVVSCLSWCYVLFLALNHLLSAKDKLSALDSLHNVVERPLQFAQTLAVLELLHSLLGWVRSPFVSAFLQVGSRLFVVWGIVFLAPSARFHPGFALASISWSLVEIPRYLYYAWNLASPTTMPYALTWLRYSLFAVLYPSGISGEIWCILRALPYIVSHPKLLSIALPNTFNFGFSYLYLCYFLLALYVPGSPFMFNHMRTQRVKQLQGKTKTQ